MVKQFCEGTNAIFDYRWVDAYWLFEIINIANGSQTSYRDLK